MFTIFPLGSKTCTEFINMNPHINKKNKTDYDENMQISNSKFRILDSSVEKLFTFG